MKFQKGADAIRQVILRNGISLVFLPIKYAIASNSLCGWQIVFAPARSQASNLGLCPHTKSHRLGRWMFTEEAKNGRHGNPRVKVDS